MGITNILSDIGDSILAFSRKNSMTNHFYHRHIIQNFRPKSGLGTFVKRILETKTYVEYLNVREEIMLVLPEDIEDGKFDGSIKNSNYFWTKWANWERVKCNIPRCSNHAEGFHGNINNKLPNKRIYSMKTGFSKIADFIMNYLTKRKDIYGESFKKKNIKLIYKVRIILKEGDDSYLKCALEKCDCQEDLYNFSIFGIKYPSIRTILHDFISGSFFQEFISIYQINLSEFFISCLKYMHST